MRPNSETCELEILSACERDKLASIIQVRIPEKRVPCQTMIASVLHTYVTGRFSEKGIHAAGVRKSAGW